MIRIKHVFPPIPDRSFDYCAYIGDGDEGTLQGWGATPKEALEDLRRVCWEHGYITKCNCEDCRK